MDELQIWKDGEQVATAAPYPNSYSTVMPEGPKWSGTGELLCFYFPRIQLSPPTVWKVLGGTALGSFMDHCSIKRLGGKVDVDIEGLRYIHGRAEVMKGRPTISTVLLARPKNPPQADVWLGYLPVIYEEFLRIYNDRTKKA
jgi:hypothetical protein